MVLEPPADAFDGLMVAGVVAQEDVVGPGGRVHRRLASLSAVSRESCRGSDELWRSSPHPKRVFRLGERRATDEEDGPPNRNPLNLVERNPVAGAVIGLRRHGRLVGGDFLSLPDGPAGLHLTSPAAKAQFR